jgi:hypothetical protein
VVNELTNAILKQSLSLHQARCNSNNNHITPSTITNTTPFKKMITNVGQKRQQANSLPRPGEVIVVRPLTPPPPTVIRERDSAVAETIKCNKSRDQSSSVLIGKQQHQQSGSSQHHNQVENQVSYFYFILFSFIQLNLFVNFLKYFL